MAEPDKPLSEKVEDGISEVPAKSGTAGTLLLVLIVTGVLGIIVLGAILLFWK
ncbi:MAG TPA: hypothetical protein VF544_05580 [Pyrinomonadaceae bacterium]|jgi:hypothetical protein